MTVSNPYLRIQELAIEALDQLHLLSEMPDDKNVDDISFVGGLTTGFFDLDRMINGLNPGELVLIAARPCVGRTSFALNIVDNLLFNESAPVMIYSGRTNALDVAKRIASSHARVRYSDLVVGQLKNDDLDRVAEVLNLLGGDSVVLEINDDPNPSFDEFMESAYDFASRHEGKGVIVIDGFLGLDGAERMNSADRWTRLDQNARALKGLARKLGIPILITSDLKSGDEKIERRKDRRPTKYDIYGGATLAAIVDTILLIHRDEVFNEASRMPGIAEIIVEKSLLSIGTVPLAFMRNMFRFENLSRSVDLY